MAKNLISGPFWHVRPKFGPPIFFSWVLSLLNVKQCLQTIIVRDFKENYLNKLKKMAT